MDRETAEKREESCLCPAECPPRVCLSLPRDSLLCVCPHEDVHAATTALTQGGNVAQAQITTLHRCVSESCTEIKVGLTSF